MPLLRKQAFVRATPPDNLKPETKVFYCEATKEIFVDYDDFFQRTILCNSLVWSCSITGKSNLTFEEAVESEEKARKRIGNLPKALKRGILWLARHTKRGRLVEVSDDVYEFSKQRYFKGEIIEAVINDQWCDAKITKIIPPTQEEIDKDKEEQEDDDIVEVEEDGTKKAPAPKPNASQIGVPDHLFKYEVEEVDPDDEDMVMLHIIPAEDCKREKGVFTKDKLNLYLKNVVELDGPHFKVKDKVSKMYDLEKIRFEDIYSGPAPTFAETASKKAVLNKNKKGQFTLDGWIKDEKAQAKSGKPIAKPAPKPAPPPVKKQTPEEVEADMKRIREAQEKRKEELRIKFEEEKKKRAEERLKEKERKKEETRIMKELIQDWNKRREDLECEDLKELPKPEPIHCHIPNQYFGEFISLLEFLNSFSEILRVEDSYPGGMTFKEFERALVEKEIPDGAFFDILSFMLISVFDLQTEEMDEAKAAKDESVLDETDRNVLGKDEETAQAIIRATETSKYTSKNLGLALRDCHLDVWSLTEVLRLHLESSGGHRSSILNNWRYQQRGGYRLADDPGLQFVRDEPQILNSLHTTLATELEVPEKLKILTVLMDQILSFADVRDEIDVRMDNMIEAQKELREAVFAENKRIRDQKAEDWKEKKEELEKKKMANTTAATAEGAEKKEVLTDRQKEAIKADEEKKEREKNRREELKRAEFLEKEKELQRSIIDYQNKASVQCLGRDRAFRRYWMFESIPGIFVEHDDDQIGSCLDEPTPWNPEAGPLTEAEALERAKDILNRTSTNVNPEEIVKTYAKKPALKQQTITVNGSIESGKSDENKENEQENQQKNGEEENGEKEEKKVLSPPWGRCDGNQDSCPVHSTILPRTHWAVLTSVEQLDELIDNLNPRGFREGELRDRLISDRENIENHFKKARFDIMTRTQEDLSADEKKMRENLTKIREKNAKYGGALALPVGTKMSDVFEISLRDQIMELEEKIHIGNIGVLKVSSREEWQTTLTTRGYQMGCDELSWGADKEHKLTPEMLLPETRASSPVEDKNKRTSTGSTNSTAAASAHQLVVKQLAASILQVGQMINDTEKYLKYPLGEEEKEKKKRLREEEKKRKEREAEEEEGIVCEEKNTLTTPFQRWETSLMSCKNLGQLFLHLTTLDNSIIWSKSIMNTKCRVCRSKKDPEKMLLCDGCDRGHHMYCLKPKLKNIPQGDWYCSDCKPKERIRSPKKKVRRVFSSVEESEDENDDSATANSDEENSEQEEEETNHRITKKKSKAKKKLIEESPEPAPKKKKKGGIANLLGKRRAADAGEQKRRGNNAASSDEEEEEMDTSTSTSTRRSGRARAAPKQETSPPEKSKSKRRRGELDDDIELQFSVVGLNDLIDGMLNHKDGWPFDRPITKSSAPDYHKIIKHPIDLGTIKSKLNSLKYTCNQEVLDDIRLMFNNCYEYNHKSAEEYGCGERLEKYFNKEVAKMGLSEEVAEPVAPAKPAKRSRRTF